MAQLPHYLLTIEDTGELGIQETSFVEYPATGLSFLAFEGEQIEHKFAKIDTPEQQRMTSGVMMMPNTKYLRADKEGNFYTVEFSADTLKQALLKYLKEDKANVIKVEHSGKSLQGFSAVEHWIIEDETTKSPIYGNTLADLGYNPEEIPAGTIMKTTYVADEKFWNEQILTGKVQGYSLGGMFELQSVEAVNQDFAAKTSVPTKEDVLKLIGVTGKDITITSTEGCELQFGESVTSNGQLADGSYTFNKDLTVVIKEGVIVDYGFDNTTNTQTIEMEQQTTQEVTPTVEVSTDATPVTEVTTETTEQSVESQSAETSNPAAVEVPNFEAKVNDLNAKLEEIMAKMAEKEAEFERLTAEKDAKINKLKEKVQEQPVKKAQPSLKDVVPTTNTNKGATVLKIGNNTIKV